jgi:hypothetical protein
MPESRWIELKDDKNVVYFSRNDPGPPTVGDLGAFQASVENNPRDDAKLFLFKA